MHVSMVLVWAQANGRYTTSWSKFDIELDVDTKFFTLHNPHLKHELLKIAQIAEYGPISPVIRTDRETGTPRAAGRPHVKKMLLCQYNGPQTKKLNNNQSTFLSQICFLGQWPALIGLSGVTRLSVSSNSTSMAKPHVFHLLKRDMVSLSSFTFTATGIEIAYSDQGWKRGF